MAEIVNCPKCGENDGKVYVQDRGWKVGKCSSCGFWGKLVKILRPPVEAETQAGKEAKKARAPRKQTASPSGGSPTPEPIPEPRIVLPNSEHRERNATPFWERDIFEFFD
jgi:hypothetical protein